MLPGSDGPHFPSRGRMVYRGLPSRLIDASLQHQTLISRSFVPQGSAVSMPFSIAAAGAPACRRRSVWACRICCARDLQRKPREPGGCVVARAGAGALPDVDPEVMVIAARGKERGAAPLAGRVEADGAAIKARRPVRCRRRAGACGRCVSHRGPWHSWSCAYPSAPAGRRCRAGRLPSRPSRHPISRFRARGRHRPRCRCLRGRRDRRIR